MRTDLQQLKQTLIWQTTFKGGYALIENNLTTEDLLAQSASLLISMACDADRQTIVNFNGRSNMTLEDLWLQYRLTREDVDVIV